jgi:hypothetical protein
MEFECLGNDFFKVFGYQIDRHRHSHQIFGIIPIDDQFDAMLGRLTDSGRRKLRCQIN